MWFVGVVEWREEGMVDGWKCVMMHANGWLGKARRVFVLSRPRRGAKRSRKAQPPNMLR
jgi:hypothetical protein